MGKKFALHEINIILFTYIRGHRHDVLSFSLNCRSVNSLNSLACLWDWCFAKLDMFAPFCCVSLKHLLQWTVRKITFQPRLSICHHESFSVQMRGEKTVCTPTVIAGSGLGALHTNFPVVAHQCNS